MMQELYCLDLLKGLTSYPGQEFCRGLMGTFVELVLSLVVVLVLQTVPEVFWPFCVI